MPASGAVRSSQSLKDVQMGTSCEVLLALAIGSQKYWSPTLRNKRSLTCLLQEYTVPVRPNLGVPPPSIGMYVLETALHSYDLVIGAGMP